ncbi:MAG: pyrroline-5-carboxylate reductase [Salinarimonadaceae bacterium]|nr:MAG: pyrroline-5-carboxylate reductase [Salinarimonadaceae bacterium]
MSISPMIENLPSSLILVGGGKMGGAMLEGWLRVGLPGEAATVIEPYPGAELVHLCALKGVALNPSADTLTPPDALVLAIKPQVLGEAAPGIRPLVDRRTTLISVLAGKTVADLDAAIPGCGGIVRSIPNLPAAIARGATGAFASAGLPAEKRAMAHALLSAVGIVAWVEDEGLIDACTAVSGSGPAYVFLLAETLAEAGVAAGLPADLARSLARATVAGAGAMLGQSELDASTLRENVTSKGGTTAAALEVLMADKGMAPLMREAVAAAKRRARELSG